MKKTTIYTLLCTTVIVSGISFAAEDGAPNANKAAGTPARSAVPSRLLATSSVDTPTRSAEHEKDLLAIQFKGTPDIREEKKAELRAASLNDEEVEQYGELATQIARADRDKAKAAKLSAIDAKKDAELLKRKQVAETAKQEEERVRHEALIGRLQVHSSQNTALEQRVAELTTSLAELSSAKTALEQKFSLDKASLDEKVRKSEITAETAKTMLTATVKSYQASVAENARQVEEKQRALRELEEQKMVADTANKGRERLERAIEGLLTQQSASVAPPPATREASQPTLTVGEGSGAKAAAPHVPVPPPAGSSGTTNGPTPPPAGGASVATNATPPVIDDTL